MRLLRWLKFNLLYHQSEPPPWDTGVSPPELLEFIAGNPHGRALDLGCGTGTNAITLAQKGWEATGVDFVPAAIRKARKKARQAGCSIQFLRRNVTNIEGIRPGFDLVLDIGCFHGLGKEDQKTYIQNLIQLLKPGGTYLLYVFFRNNPDESGPGVVGSDLEEIAEQLTLVSREDGLERESRLSAWLKYKRKDKGTSRS
jgi:cyclopropane fatty-acyl-phospholipid synthase-like methyltransferase